MKHFILAGRRGRIPGRGPVLYQFADVNEQSLPIVNAFLRETAS